MAIFIYPHCEKVTCGFGTDMQKFNSCVGNAIRNREYYYDGS